jgi:hypothetical protein
VVSSCSHCKLVRNDVRLHQVGLHLLDALAAEHPALVRHELGARRRNRLLLLVTLQLLRLHTARTGAEQVAKAADGRRHLLVDGEAILVQPVLSAGAEQRQHAVCGEYAGELAVLAATGALPNAF